MELLPPGDPWASYARTVVVVARPGMANFTVAAAPPGSAGPWPWTTADALHILTAWDPGGTRMSEEENRANEEALVTELAELGPDGTWTAVGVDPLSGHREEGVAVCGLTLDAVLDVGARYGQDAIFEWTPAVWAIVACGGERRVDLGWGPAEELRPTLDVLREA